MRLLYSAVFKTGSAQGAGKEGPVLLTSAKELSSFSYFQRGTIGEMFAFFSRTFAANKGLAPGARTSVKHQSFLCHVYVSPFGVTAACFADDEYPQRVAFGYLSKLCEDLQQATGGQFPTSTEDNCVAAFQVGSPSPPTPLAPRCLLDRPSSAPDGSPSCGPPLVLCRQPTRSCCFSFRTLRRQIS